MHHIIITIVLPYLDVVSGGAISRQGDGTAELVVIGFDDLKLGLAFGHYSRLKRLSSRRGLTLKPNETQDGGLQNLRNNTIR